MRVHSLLAAAAVLCTNSGEHIVCREPGRAEPIAEIRPSAATDHGGLLPNEPADTWRECLRILADQASHRDELERRGNR